MSRNFHAGLILMLMISSLLGGCNVQDRAVLQVVERNIQACEDEEVATYMGTIHPSSPLRAETESVLVPLFQKYDLDYEIKEIRLLGINGDEATVEVTQHTRRIAGDTDYKDNVTVARHYLRRVNDRWYLYNTELISARPLEEQRD